MFDPFFVSFIIYFIFLLAIGLIAHRKHTSAADFMVGARSLNFWVTALSAHASDMSSWLFMGLPMIVFMKGLPAIWIALGLLGGMFVNWHYIAPKLRVATERYNSFTLSAFFESHFRDQSGVLRLLSASLMLIFLTHYLSAGLISLGVLFESLFQVDYMLGIFIATAVMLAYTSLGGFVAVAWADFFQGIFLLIMILIVPTVAYRELSGGWDSIVSCAANRQVSLNIFPHSLGEAWSLLTLALSWGLGYLGMPQVLSKFMGIRSPSEIYKAKILGLSWQLLSLLAATASGLVGIAYFCQGIDNAELVFVKMCTSLFSPLMAGLVLCAILAATISTMDSQILVISGIITDDFYDNFFNRQKNEKKMLLVSRLSICAVSIAALLIASSRSTTIYDSVFYAWTGLGCSFGPLMLSSLYAKTLNRNGAIAGICTGGLFGLLYPKLASPELLELLPTMIPGFLASLVAIHLVSRTGQSPAV